MRCPCRRLHHRAWRRRSPAQGASRFFPCYRFRPSRGGHPVTSILQISDTHLSPRTMLFRRNLALLGEWAAAARPDLIVVTGDLSLDGADRDADLDFAAGLLRGLPAPLLLLPGNHDVGSDPRTSPRQPVDAARLARFRRLAGEDTWLRDLPGWRLVGLNSE